LRLARSVTIRGTIEAANGPAGAVVAHIVSDEPQAAWQRSPVINVSGDGKLVAFGVAPGRYTIEARTLSGANGGASAGGWASVSILVREANVESVGLVLSPYGSISGRIESDAVVQGATPDAEVTLIPERLTSGSWFATQMMRSSDGRFTFPEVPPGKYRVGVKLDEARVLAGWAPIRVSVGGREAADAFVEIESGQRANAVIVLGQRQTELRGSLSTGAGRPVPDHLLIIFPQDQTQWLWLSPRIQAIRPGQDGTFVTRTLPAGNYFLAVVNDLEQDEWFDPGILALLVPGSIPIRLVEGQVTVQGIRTAAP
jgi:hypothetical protein